MLVDLAARASIRSRKGEGEEVDPAGPAKSVETAGNSSMFLTLPPLS